jgi:23S rRNA (uracil1939-C5)-methyltransferase
MKLHIDKAIYGGSGLGRVSDEAESLFGKTVFVPFALPGEDVELHITQDKKSYAIAELDSVLKESDARTRPLCPYFGECGGCHYQHSLYEGQLEMKRAILRETLERARLSELPEIASLAGEPWSYRNRIRLLVRSKPDFGLCYRRRGSHSTLAVDQCPIAAPILQRAITKIVSIGAASGIGELCEEIEFFTNGDESSLVISMFCTQTPRSAKTLLEKACAALADSIPELVGAVLFAHGEDNHGQPVARWGNDSLVYHAGGYEYRVSIGSFFQVNRFLIDPLAALVVDGRKGALAWDLYSGVGLFSRRLAEQFERVIAVESAASSSSDLAHNLQGTSHRALRLNTRDFLRQHGRNTTPSPDLIVVDPPRSGLGEEVCSLLAKAGSAEIVYVSCDPATLSRDLRTLVQSGYHLKNIHLVDLFPQTFHMESVVGLARG